MIKNNWLVAVFLLFGIGLYGQTVEGIRPPSWEINSVDLPLINTIEFAPIDREKLLQEVLKNEEINTQKIFRFGKEKDTLINVFESQNSIYFEDIQGYITRLKITSPNSLSINLIFSEFELAEGAQLFLYNSEQTALIGAHTAKNNNSNKSLGTGIISGETIIIEVFEPVANKGKSKLKIGTVVQGFRKIEEFEGITAKNLNGSGACNIDVNCPLGLPWNQQMRGIARVLRGGSFCSGTLVNNTSDDIIPYFLSARHCGNLNNAVFRFRWEAPVNGVSCATTSPSTNGPTNMEINGSTLIAENGNADFKLILLNNTPDPSWGIYYNGWDNSDLENVDFVKGIHHPSGDLKKVCFAGQSPTQEALFFNGTNNAEMWRVDPWTEGVTEVGSSGSPLFNQNGHVIGVLSGGTAACNGTVNNNGFDVYGRFGVAWNNLPETNNQLAHWLDPLGLGVTTLGGFDPLFVGDCPGEVFHLDLNLDCFGEETSWEIIDEQGNVLHFGDDYTSDENGQNIARSFCLPGGCYEFVLIDAAGNGLAGATQSNCEINGSMQLRRIMNNEIIGELSAENADFGSELRIAFCASGLGNEEHQLKNNLVVFPNPSAGALQISYELTSKGELMVIDGLGRVVFSNSLNSGSLHTFELNHLPSGMYTILVNNQQTVSTAKWVKK
jgi:lysyl endopeptidase